MLPYHDDGKNLEELLESLFNDDDGSAPEDVEILGWPGPRPYGNCCTLSYSSYGGK